MKTFHSTFTPIGDKERIFAKLEEVSAELEEDMERTGWTGKTVTLKYKLDTYQGLCLNIGPTLHNLRLYGLTDPTPQSSPELNPSTDGYPRKKKTYLQ